MNNKPVGYTWTNTLGLVHGLSFSLHITGDNMDVLSVVQALYNGVVGRRHRGAVVLPRHREGRRTTETIRARPGKGIDTSSGEGITILIGCWFEDSHISAR